MSKTPNQMLDHRTTGLKGDAVFLERLSKWVGTAPHGYVNAAMRLFGIARRLRKLAGKDKKAKG